MKARFSRRGDEFRRTADHKAKGADGMAERLDKILSSQGAATRREAQRLIRSGKVTVDGTVQRDPSVKVAVIETVKSCIPAERCFTAVICM